MRVGSRFTLNRPFFASSTLARKAADDYVHGLSNITVTDYQSASVLRCSRAKCYSFPVTMPWMTKLLYHHRTTLHLRTRGHGRPTYSLSLPIYTWHLRGSRAAPSMRTHGERKSTDQCENDPMTTEGHTHTYRHGELGISLQHQAGIRSSENNSKA